jgi:hypothetical protein
MTPPLEKWLAEVEKRVELGDRLAVTYALDDVRLLVKLLRKCREQRNYVIINCRGGLDDRSEAMEKGDAELTQIISDTLGAE